MYCRFVWCPCSAFTTTPHLGGKCVNWFTAVSFETRKQLLEKTSFLLPSHPNLVCHLWNQTAATSRVKNTQPEMGERHEVWRLTFRVKIENFIYLENGVKWRSSDWGRPFCPLGGPVISDFKVTAFCKQAMQPFTHSPAKSPRSPKGAGKDSGSRTLSWCWVTPLGFISSLQEALEKALEKIS